MTNSALRLFDPHVTWQYNLATNFERDLFELFGDEMITDRSFAQEVYAALCDTEWYREDGTTGWQMTRRYAARTVYDMRGVHRSPHGNADRHKDFFDSGGEGIVKPKIARKMAERGWFSRLVTFKVFGQQVEKSEA